LKLEYDKNVGAAYINLIPSQSAAATRTYACDPEEVGGQIQLDFDDAGQSIGIEVLDASHLLPAAVLESGTPD
jgi:uncharacterized protein YuzE